ncbi:MAG: helix-turn-helix domain-containing protein [Blastocatellia bacterium]
MYKKDYGQGCDTKTAATVLPTYLHFSGTSRSAFASRFTKSAGEPPLRYLARRWMRKAIEMIRENRLTTAEVASLAGYESEAAFSKAFKKWLRSRSPMLSATSPKRCVLCS